MDSQKSTVDIDSETVSLPRGEEADSKCQWGVITVDYHVSFVYTIRWLYIDSAMLSIDHYLCG